jgi:hypothetical protein
VVVSAIFAASGCSVVFEGSSYGGMRNCVERFDKELNRQPCGAVTASHLPVNPAPAHVWYKR